MAVPYHTHTFEIPVASKEETGEASISDKVLAPSSVGTSAAKDIGFFATAAQGSKADTALQPAAIGASVQAYSANLDLFAAAGPSAFATAAEGALAGSALQPADVEPIGDYDGTRIPKTFNILSAYIDIQSEFGITGDGITDDTPGFQALATFAESDVSKIFRARRGATYRVDSAQNLIFPVGSQFEMLTARFVRGASLSSSNRIFQFSSDCGFEDRFRLELEEGVVYQRLVRFTDGCFIPEIEINAATRNQVILSPNDHALTWIGEAGTESMKWAGYGELAATNIDVLSYFYRPAAGPGDSTPARDIKIGNARTKNCGLIVWVRNCMDVSVGDLLNVGAPIGGSTGEDSYVLLMNGVQNLYANSVRGVEMLSHVCRNSGPSNANDISDRNIQIGSISSIRGHRTAYKTQPGLEGQRISKVQIGQIMADDNGYDGDAGVVPESNEEIVRLDCADGVQIGRILGRNKDRAYSCYDGLVIANSTGVTVDSYDVENPYRHHISFLRYTQGGLADGPVKDCRIGYVRGYRSLSGNQDANVLIDCAGHDFSNNNIDHFEFANGTDVFEIIADTAPTRSVFKGKAVGFSGLPVNYMNGSNWRARQNLIFADLGRDISAGIMVNSYFGYAPRGAGPFTASGQALGHGRLTNGAGSSNSISRVQGKISDTALEWDQTIKGTNASFYETRIANPRNLAGKWVSVVFTAWSTDAANRAAVYASVNYGSGGSSTWQSPVRFFLLTQTPQEFCMPFFVPEDSSLTYGANNRFAVVFQRSSGDPSGKITIEKFDLFQTPFPPTFSEKGSVDYVVAATIAEL